MTLRVLYLGRLQDVAGRPESQFSVGSADLGWAGLIAALEGHVNPDIAAAAADESTRVAVNGVLQPGREVLVFRHGDEVALLPPVSGG